MACTSAKSVRLAAERALPMLLGMHCGDEEKAEMVALWRTHAIAMRPPARGGRRRRARIGGGGADRRQPHGGDRDAREGDAGLAAARARRPCDGGRQAQVHARSRRVHGAVVRSASGGAPGLAADRLAATAERTGITRFALLVEGSGDLAATEENVRRMGAEVLSRLR